MNELIIQTILTMSITGTIVALIFFLIKPLIKNRITKFAQYCTWLIIVMAFLTPLSLLITLPEETHEFTPQTVNETVKQYIIPSNIESTNTNNLNEASKSADNTGASNSGVSKEQVPKSQIISAALGIWLLGAVLYLLHNLWGYLNFVYKLKHKYVKASSNDMAILSALTKGKRKPDLFRSDMAPTPMLIGIIKPVIILPINDYSDTKLEYILLHELTHFRRHDIIIKWFVVLSNALHWFNPVIYLVRKETEKTCEMSCDEAVISNSDNKYKQGYGETLIDVAAEKKLPNTVLSTTMSEEKRVLKERLTSIKNSKKTTKVKVAASAILLVIVLCAVIIIGASINEKNDSWAEQFPADLAANGFLPEKIVNDFSQYDREDDSDGATLHYWRTWNNEKEDVNHEIEMTEKDGVLISYLYKNYYFDVPYLDSSISKDAAASLVTRFADQYISNSETLSFNNKPSNHTLYDPGLVELWFSDSGNKHYTIAVDLEMGSVIYFDSYPQEEEGQYDTYLVEGETEGLELMIYDDKEYFVFTDMLMSSNPPTGDLKISDKELILFAEDGNQLHFEIKDDTLIYKESQSYIKSDKDAHFDRLEDGMVFVLQNEKNQREGSTTNGATEAKYEKFEKFPDVIDITSYLGTNLESVNMLYSGDKKMGFSFYENDYEDGSTAPSFQYAKLLESEGYELTGRDATISSTFELTNNNYFIQITSFLDPDEFKETHSDIENIDRITKEDNILFQIEKID